MRRIHPSRRPLPLVATGPWDGYDWMTNASHPDALAPIAGRFAAYTTRQGVHMESLTSAPPSVRELIMELSGVEDALRQARRLTTGQGSGAFEEPDVVGLVHREQVIVNELRRRRARSPQLGRRPDRLRLRR